MGVHKQSVSFSEQAFGFAQELVDSGEYPNISAAVSGELTRAKAARDHEHALLEAELLRRLALPLDQWVPVTGRFTDEARARLLELAAGK